MVAKANAASIPRSEKALRRATCASSDAVGDVVYVTGPEVGSLLQVSALEVTGSTDPAPAGVITRKIDATTCVVQLHGPTLDIYSGLTAGEVYFVGSDAIPTLTPAVGSHIIGLAIDDEKLFVQPRRITSGNGGGLLVERVGVDLIGTKDGLNREFSIPGGETFVHVPGSRTIRVHHNGRRLRWSSSGSPEDGDFEVVESGGAGTGFDTVRMLRFLPNGRSGLFADYFVVV